MPPETLLSPEIYRKLSALRRALRVHLVGRGLCWLILALVGAVFFTLAIDYPLRLDRAQRALIMALVLGGVGYVVWRFLLRPLLVPMDAEELALVLENHYPQLDDRLISSLQFVTSPTSRAGASAALIHKVLQQTNALAGQLHPGEPVEAAGTWTRAAWPGGATIVLLVFSVWQWPIMGPWFMRNVLLSNALYPQQTYLTVEGGPEFRVVRDGDLTVRVWADERHVVPAQVTFQTEYPGLGKLDENVFGTGPNRNLYVKTFERVADSFYFSVRGNDARTDKFRVVVRPRPELVALSGVKHFPDYMNLQGKDEAFKAEHGIISVPPGTQLRLAGRADKDLASARLLLRGQPPVDMRIRDVPPPEDPEGGLRPQGIEGMVEIPPVTQLPEMELRFELTDTEGLTNTRGAVYTLRIDPDGPPRVSMDRRFVRGEVTPRATIPLVIKVTDDYGLDRVSVTAEGVLEGASKTRPAAQEFEAAKIASKDKEVSLGYDLELQKMTLQVGQLVRLQALARDTLPESFEGPNVGKSVVQTYKIVSEAELLEELVRRQKEIREEFELAVILQAEVRDKIRAMGDRLAGAGLDAEAKRFLNEAVKGQRRVAAQCAVTAQQLQDVLEEMNCNRVGAPAEKRSLAEDIIAPLDEICKKPMNDMVAQMDRASNIDNAAGLGSFAKDTHAVLDGFYNYLEMILKAMKRYESRRELAQRLKVIIGISEGILKAIQKELERQGINVFDSTTQPVQPPEK